MGRIVSVTEFKARCLEFFEQLRKGEIDRIDVTKHGRAIGVVHPPRTSREAIEMGLKSMQRSVQVIDAGLDLTLPIAWDQEFVPDLPEADSR